MKYLVPDILTMYVAAFEPHFTKSSFLYFGSYILSRLITGGRKTTNRVAHTCFWVDRHLASWERFLAEYKWDLSAVCATLVDLIREQASVELLLHGAYVVALDTTLIAKNGTQMPGIQKWHDHSGNADRGNTIRGHQWGVLGLIGYSATQERHLCFPVLMDLIPGQLNPFRFIVDAEGAITRITLWEVVHALIVQIWDQVGAPVRVVADAYFSKAPFVQPLVERGIHVVTRLRKDRVGWDDSDHNHKWKLAALLEHMKPERITVHIYGDDRQVTAVSREVWLRNLDQKVKVVVIKGRAEPTLLLATDLTLSMAQIIELYAARFTIEVAIRDLKTHFGLTEYQCYRSISIHRFVHLGCIAFCLFRMIHLSDPDWLPAPSRDVAPLSFTRIRTGLQRYILERILSPKFRESPNSEEYGSQLDAIMRIAA